MMLVTILPNLDPIGKKSFLLLKKRLNSLTSLGSLLVIVEVLGRVMVGHLDLDLVVGVVGSHHQSQSLPFPFSPPLMIYHP